MIDVETVFGSPTALQTVGELCERFGVRRLDIFGSGARGADFDPARSDIDLLVAFNDLPPGSYADAYFGLHEALESLAQRKVDLLTDDALENPFLRRRIDAERHLLFPMP